MSPSESDLRSALAHGEGDPVDVHAVLSAGRARVARGRRIRGGAGAVVIVAGFATGGVALARSGVFDQSDAAGGGGMAAPAASTTTLASSAAGAASRPGSRADAKAAPQLSCPRSAPALERPGQVRASAALFAKPVAAMLVCAYGTSGGPTQTALMGAPARALAASLEHASRTPVPGACPAYERADERRLAFIADANDGTVLPTVTTTLNAPACGIVVSNGTAVRYGWTPPAQLGPVLRQLVRPRGGPMQGSPIHS